MFTINIRRVSGFGVILFMVLISVVLSRCGDVEVTGSTGMAMVDIDFNNRIENTGMADIEIEGNGVYEYEASLNDTSLNLSGTSKIRKPVVITCSNENSFADYGEFTAEVWVKKVVGDNERYVIAGSKEPFEESFVGWEFVTAVNGSWAWVMSDGESQWSYNPTDKIQNLNDDQWHQLVFSLNRSKSEARVYFDGKNRALFSLTELHNSCISHRFYIGADPMAMDFRMETLNGFVGGFKIWARALKDEEVENSFIAHSSKQLSVVEKPKGRISVMTWNIWHGGKHPGKTVGIQRVADVIRDSNADIILLQETDGSGEKIADALGYSYFYRSTNLSVLSRYPFVDSYDIFKPHNFGCVSVDVGGKGDVLFCPVWLDNLPNIGAYIKAGSAIPDSIIERERQTRGRQMRFILGELASFSQSKNHTLVVAGDFNSGSHLDWTERNRKNYHNLVVEFPVSKLMEEQGFIDTYRMIHPDETINLGQTWSPVFKNSLQDRIDFIYYKGDKLKPVTSYIIDNHPYGFPSDHAALVTVFFLNK
jgi:endonuclease/exonuclease/phosphatase family metal-dependent hydrolase